MAGITAAQRVVQEISRACAGARCVLMAPQDELEKFRALQFANAEVDVIAGGATRQESVRAGLEYLAARQCLEPREVVLVHDVARCLVQSELVRRSVEAARQHGAVTTAIPVVDSMVRMDPETGEVRSLARNALYAVQTPQAFHFELLLRAHREGPPGATDDASLVEKIHPVQMIPGDSENFKITTPDDLERAELILRRRPTLAAQG